MAVNALGNQRSSRPTASAWSSHLNRSAMPVTSPLDGEPRRLPLQQQSRFICCAGRPMAMRFSRGAHRQLTDSQPATAALCASGLAVPAAAEANHQATHLGNRVNNAVPLASGRGRCCTASFGRAQCGFYRAPIAGGTEPGLPPFAAGGRQLRCTVGNDLVFASRSSPAPPAAGWTRWRAPVKVEL